MHETKHLDPELELEIKAFALDVNPRALHETTLLLTPKVLFL